MTVSALLALVASAVFRPDEQAATPERLMAEARAALSRGDAAAAEASARKALAENPRHAAALLLAGEAATKAGRFDAALEYYGRVPQEDPEAATARWAAGEILLMQGNSSDAEDRFRSALEADPGHVMSHYRLSFLLTNEGRRWESLPHLMALVRQGQFELKTLLYLGNIEPLIDAEEHIALYRRGDPDDPAPLIASAQLALRENRREEAERLLRQVIAADADLAEAQVQLGLILAESGSEEEFLEWHAHVPDSTESHPELWVVRGLWARRHGNDEQAARCFWEALRLDPDRRAANYLLGQALSALGRPDEAAPFLERQHRLDALIRTLDQIFFTPQPDFDLMRQAADQTEALGRLWEAWGWYRLVSLTPARPDWAVAGEQRLRAELSRLDPDSRTVAAASPALRIDLSDNPSPEWIASKTPGEQTEQVGSAPIVFADVTTDSGIEFRYFESPSPEGAPRKMYEFAGGGVAALDYDCDGWPDLYFTQGSRWPVDPTDRSYLDLLYRNLGGKRAQDVTERAGIVETGFGQGVAAGDYDGDGFADLYVANIGRNRLFRNNGDGTFTDVTEEAGIDDARWTTSCLIADLDGDALADLYDVNYLRGEDLFERVCPWPGGELRICGPAEFEAEQDQFRINGGDGRFENHTAESGIAVPNGKGLGIVAADFDGAGRLDLFVANDQTANFLFVNQTSSSGEPRFDERGLVTGLAYDRDGRTQACMGVAAGDADGDGRLDLFITNFYEESNTLYQQQSGGFFVDATLPAGLRDPGFLMLGFGTQFLDADLDGLEDLVVTNGHIDDFTYDGIPFGMPPQFYRNSGGQFVEVPRDSLGGYFAGDYRGRGLTRLDWDRDGRDDFVVSHLDDPAALVVNRTETAAHGLVLRLRGTASARDAIGAVVTVTAGPDRLVRQLTAGDGYQASNERSLTIGLGSLDRADEVRVRWPSGREQTFRDLPADGEYLLVEGRGSPLLLRRTSPLGASVAVSQPYREASLSHD